MRTESKLVVGLPSGSLADPSRGGSLFELLRAAGYATKGYDKGGPSTFPLMPYLVGWDGRPQEFGAQLALSEVDIAIGGDDWMTERRLELRYEYGESINLERVLPLKRGGVRIVVIGREEDAAKPCEEWLRGLLKKKRLVTVVSEMPYLAADWFERKASQLGFAETHAGFSVQKYRTPPRIESGIVIYETWGKTEAKVAQGAVDFGFEITQTGSALRNYGLGIVDTLMESEAAVWASPALKDQPEKYDLAKMLLLNLYGSIYAENKVLLMFNARKAGVDKLLDYLRDNNLFGDEPTINEGVNFTEFSVQLDAANPKLPLAQVRYELAKIGATNIETVPLESSIPGLDVIDF